MNEQLYKRISKHRSQMEFSGATKRDSTEEPFYPPFVPWESQKIQRMGLGKHFFPPGQIFLLFKILSFKLILFEVRDRKGFLIGKRELEYN